MTSLIVPFVNVAAQFNAMESDLVEIFKRVGQSGMYVMGQEVTDFDKALAQYCESEYAFSVGNGTDALILALKALDIGVGDEVITAPNSFIASAGAIAAVGAKIKFADVGDDFNLDVNAVKSAITDKTKAIIAVHLTGNPADIDGLKQATQGHNIKIIEDAAQAIGAKYKNRAVGSLGDIACFSLHPLKNFHLLGDAGFITTNDVAIAKNIQLLRNHGLINRDESAQWGLNSRCDTLQAAIGLYKLPKLAQWTKRFQQIAKRYTELLSGHVICPSIAANNQAVFHNYVIQVEDRDHLMSALQARGVATKIHYPIPLHLMKASYELGYQQGDFPKTEKQAKHILSLPIYPELTDEQVDYVAASVIACLHS
ncbi:DegT/DnrJ/EryC1/StrS family aminotransferase [Thalassotalea agariperforans]